METLKSDYAEILNSSDEYFDPEDDVPGKANFDKSIKKEINSYQDIFKDEGIAGLRRALSQNSNKWKNIGLHIAVTGSSGAGKSSFINAIRDVRADEEGGAEVGVTETTTELTPFTHPNNPNFIVWDMPGVGTPKYPRQNYIECVKFKRYDFFMILSQSRFTEDDMWLAKEIHKQKKRFYFIRTNIDTDISNDKRTHKNHSPQQVMNRVTHECQKNLIEAGFNEPVVYLVDNLDRQLYDFGKLELRIVQDTDNLKMEAMALSLSVLTGAILKKKKEILKERIKDKAMEIASLEEDDSEKQRTIFVEEMALYRKQYSLDEKTLDGHKDILSLSDENLKEFHSVFKKMSFPALTGLLRKRRHSSILRLLYDLLRKWQGIPSESYSEPVLQFSCFALHQNLEKVHRIALKVYNLDAQKVLVQSVWSS